MLKNYFKLAWRNLGKGKLSSILNITGLAIAMAVAVLMLLWVKNEASYDNYHPDTKRIYLLTRYDTTNTSFATENSPLPAYQAIQSSVPEAALVTMATPTTWKNILFKINGDVFTEKNALLVDSNWTKMFSYKVVEGSLQRFTAQSNSIVLTKSKAKKYFGDAPALTQTLLIDSVLFSVAAVVEDNPVNSSFQQDVLIPNSFLLNNESVRKNLDDWGYRSQLLFVKLRENASAVTTAKKISGIFTSHQNWKSESAEFSVLSPLTGLHFQKELNSTTFKQGNPQNIRIYTILAILLLATACANFVNLTVAQAGNRLKEIGVRKIMGASKKQLFGQVMTEIAFFILLSMGLALVFAIIAMPVFNAFTEKNFALNIFDPSVASLLLTVFVFVLLFTGIYPALLLATLKPAGLLKNKAIANISRQGLRKVLVTGQLTLVVITLVGVITLQKQFRYIQQSTSSYQKGQVFKFRALPPEAPIKMSDENAIKQRISYLKNIKISLLKNSAIESVSLVNGVSMFDAKNKMTSDIVWTGYPAPEQKPEVVQLWVDEDYRQVANLTMQSGRWFDPQNISDKNNLVLNETAVKMLGLKEPVVGSTFSGGIHDNSGVVIGVVKDFHHKSLHEKIDPLIISMDPFMGSLYYVKAHGTNIDRALKEAGAIWAANYPGKPFEYVFLDEEFDKLYKEDQKALTFSMLFGGLCIVLSALGLLGLVIVSAQQRVKEIGIRKVLGASVTGIVAMLSRDFVKMVLLAAIIGFPIAWWTMNRWLADYAYRVTLEWWMFAAAGSIALFVTLLTIAVQAMKSAMANPVKSLRNE